MRDYARIDKYLDKLGLEIYPQPQDEGHSALAAESINKFMELAKDVTSVLDLGCGEGFCQDYFVNMKYNGVCLHDDYATAKSLGRSVISADFSFLPFSDQSYDFLYSRHSLEHSPIPLLTLMEWNRVTRKYLAIVVPAPEYWGFSGRNHYFVLNRRQWKNLFNVSGFSVIYEDVKLKKMFVEDDAKESSVEYWFLLEKKNDSI